MPVRTRLERAADARRGHALLLGDRDDVALRLALDPQVRDGVGQDHELLAVEAQEHDVGVDRGLGERPVDDGARLLRAPTGISGTTSIVTHPVSSSAATSELPATSASVLNPWVRLPTLQLPWSAATVENVRSVAFIQNTHPAGTRPVRPSGSASGIGSSNGATPAGVDSWNEMASGGEESLSESASWDASWDQSCLGMSRETSHPLASPEFGDLGVEVEGRDGCVVLVLAPLLRAGPST